MCVLKGHALLAATRRFACFVRSTLPMASNEGKDGVGVRELATAPHVYVNERKGYNNRVKIVPAPAWLLEP